jgi:hypothetical protein
VINTIIGIPVAGNVKNVKEVRPESENVLLFPETKVFE